MIRSKILAYRLPAIAALCAVAVLLATSPEAFAATLGHVAAHGGGAHDLLSHVVTASLSVAALRGKVGDLETRATAKMAEVKDGLAPDALRAIEAEHGTILTELEGVRRAPCQRARHRDHPRPGAHERAVSPGRHPRRRPPAASR